MKKIMTREEVLQKGYAAHTLSEVQAAQEARSQWLRTHPEDAAVRHIGEMLAMTEEALKLEGETSPGMALSSDGQLTAGVS